jgi:transmembrane protein EpsG
VDFSVWSWPTSLFYMSIAVLPGILANISQRKSSLFYKTDINISVTTRSVLLLIAFIVPWLAAAIRYDVGSDYFSYIRIYEDIASKGILWALETLRTEPGYALLNWLVFIIFDNKQFVFIITSFFTIGLIFLTIKQHKETANIGIAVFIFLVAYYFWMWTVIRIGLSIAIVFYAYRFIINKDILKYTALVLLASFFHYTALIVWPLYFLINSTKTNKMIFYSFFYVVAVVLFLFFDVLSGAVLSGTKFEAYVNFLGNLSSSLNQIILKLPIYFLLLAYSRTLKAIDKRNIVYLRIYFIGIVLLSLTLWLGIIDRALNYFFIVEVLLVSSLLKMKEINERMLIMSLVCFYYTAIFIYFRLTNAQFIPYTNIFGWSI